MSLKQLIEVAQRNNWTTSSVHGGTLTLTHEQKGNVYISALSKVVPRYIHEMISN